MPLYGSLNRYELDGSGIDGIRVSIPFPRKTAYVRLPTAEELFAFVKGKQEEADKLVLFNLLRVDHGDLFDEYEAAAVIENLIQSKGSSHTRAGDTYVIEVQTPFGVTSHTLSVPTQKQLALFRRNSVKNYVNSVISFYKELCQSTGGYVETIAKADVPVTHQLDCLNRMFAALEEIDPILPN